MLYFFHYKGINNMTLEFEWDEEKANINLQKHGIPFETAAKVFLDKNATLTSEEKEILAAAKKLPVVYDEDSPELTDDMERAFIAARKAKPYQGEPITLYVSPLTIEKVKKMEGDYIAILGKLLDNAVREYHVI